jgi:hypothetical protein
VGEDCLAHSIVEIQGGFKNLKITLSVVAYVYNPSNLGGIEAGGSQVGEQPQQKKEARPCLKNK